MSFKTARPQHVAFTRTDKFLGKLSISVGSFLSKQKSSLIHALSQYQIKELAQILTEFAEDTYFEIGLWEALEQHNEKVFGNPLPFSKPEEEEASDYPYDEYRIHYLLWNSITILQRGKQVSPHHKELLPLAESLSYFFEERMTKIPQINGLKKFLRGPNKISYDIKAKTMWVGRSSYLFRNLYLQYLKSKDVLNAAYLKQAPHMDEFVYNSTTIWSGLGALDISKEVMGLTDDQKEEVDSWYDAHFAFYEIVEKDKLTVTVQNKFTGELYKMPKVDNFSLYAFYTIGTIILGHLVPLNKQWYWQGGQSNLGKLPLTELEKGLKNYNEKDPRALYVYDKQKLNKALRVAESHTKLFIEFFGDDLVIFDTGKDAGDALFEQLKSQNESLQRISGDVVRNQIEDTPESLLPLAIYNTDKGVALFMNPFVGEEFIPNINLFINALEKKGKDLTKQDIDTIYHFMQSDFTPEFMYRFLRDYDKTSIAVVYGLEELPTYWLDYLIRKNRGRSYRNRYPSLVVE